MKDVENFPENSTKNIKPNHLTQDNCLHVATFKSFDDQFLIYLNVYTFQWILMLKINDPGARNFLSDVEETNNHYLSYHIKEDFNQVENILNDIIYQDFDYEIRPKANRWWSYLPAWVYLETVFINQPFIKYFQQILDKNLESLLVDEVLSKSEKEYLNIWCENTVGENKVKITMN